MGRLLAAVACPSSAAALPPPAPPSPALDLALNLEDVAHHLRLENRKLKPTGDLPSLMSSSEDVRVSTTLNEPKSRPMYTGASGVAVASPGHSTLTLMWYCTPHGCERHGQRVDHTGQRLRVGDLDVEHLGARSRLARVERDRHAGNLPRREKARGGRDGVARQLGRAARGSAAGCSPIASRSACTIDQRCGSAEREAICTTLVSERPMSSRWNSTVCDESATAGVE